MFGRKNKIVMPIKWQIQPASTSHYVQQERNNAKNGDDTQKQHDEIRILLNLAPLIITQPRVLKDLLS